MNWRPSRAPHWPAPPDVNASSTRIVGQSDDRRLTCSPTCVNSKRSSLNSFLPIVRVLRTRSVSVIVSVWIRALDQIEIADAEIALRVVAARELARAAVAVGRAPARAAR